MKLLLNEYKGYEQNYWEKIIKKKLFQMEEHLNIKRHQY